MNTVPVSERVKKLSAEYENCPIQKDKTLSYNLCGRQRYLFVKGWSLARESNTLLRRSAAYAYVLKNMNPVISDNELIVGQRDFEIESENEKSEWKELSKYQGLIPCDNGRCDHKSLDFEKLLKTGVDGLLLEISEQIKLLDLNSSEDMEKYNFYKCTQCELEALLTLAENYSIHALKLSENTQGKRKDELKEISEILKRIPKHPAKTLREALQSMHFYTFCLWGLYQCGHPDRYLLSYYQNDIKNGLIAHEEAQELIDCFCLMYTTYVNSDSSIGFMIGGRDSDGNNVENELTYMFMQSIEHIKKADPSIGLCVTSETSDSLLLYAAKLLTQGYSHPAIYNDSKITEALIAYGVKECDAHNYIHSCCVEITIDKKSDVWVVSPYHNTLEYLLDILKKHEDCGSFDELLAYYSDYVREKIIEKNMLENMWQLERSHNAGEPALVSCLVDDCLKKGKGIHSGGAVYNWTQPDFIGISNAVEALLTVEKFVFNEKELTIKELNKILDKNYSGHEDFQKRIIKEVTHFGTGDGKADALYKRITDMISENCKGITNYRGDILIPAAFSYNEHIRHGKNTAASPDGRFSGEPLADGSNPVQGRDSSGPTGMLLSVTSWNQGLFLGGIATNLKIRKGSDEKSCVALLALIRTFLAQGGIELQVNAFDTDELKDAVKNPSKHTDLLVRIGGYSDYFISVSPELQQEIISRSENQL